MKKQSPRSGFINFRLLIACTLGLASLSLAVAAFGAWPMLPMMARYASKLQAARDARMKVINAKLGRGEAMTGTSAPSSVNGNTTSGSGPAQPFNGVQPTVTTHRNPQGQIVYSIAASH